MKISYEKHGVEGIENCLVYLAAFDADDIESDEFEIIGEDEEGREGSADISIINLAEEACRALAAQRKRIAQLEQERDKCRAAEEMQIALRQKADEREAALARDASYHQQEIDSLLGRLRKAQTERDVHMAHSARVNEVLFKTFSAIEDGDESALPYDEYRDAFNDAPTASLARRDAEVLRKYADMLEAEEAPDAEAGDMWDASQCAEWMREQAEKAEGHQ